MKNGAAVYVAALFQASSQAEVKINGGETAVFVTFEMLEVLFLKCILNVMD